MSVIMNCNVTGSKSPTLAGDVSPSIGFSVEMQALSIVHSSPELEPQTHSLEAVQPTEDAANFDNLSTAELTDLGDALASMLATGNHVEQTTTTATATSYEESSLSQSPLTNRISSCSSPEDKSANTSITSQDIIDVVDLDVSDGVSAASPENASLLGGKSPASSDSEEDYSISDDHVKKNGKIIKLPQRKGGMQLWQFLYALLSDPQYKDLIEWTSNVKEREFRLHEPEAIAVWWGDHKNKRNMSYDKLSRSLRYYYDKGIIRKINGQRYVYRFCVAPEVMYRHIGNSDCRPKLKPMSLAAQNALSTATYSTMLYPSHTGMYGGHYIIPSYSNQPPTYRSTSPPYPHPHHQQHSLPPQFPVLTSASNLMGGIPSGQINYQPSEINGYQSHLLSPHKHCTMTHLNGYMFTGGIESNNYHTNPILMQDSGFHSMLSDGTPSPQPISPQSLPSSFLHHSSSPLTPPPPYTETGLSW